MNGYESSTPRATLGLTALAMTVITMGALVLLPAKLDAASADPRTAAAKVATNAPTASVMSAARADVPGGVGDEENIQAGEDISIGCTTPGARDLRENVTD